MRLLEDSTNRRDRRQGIRKNGGHWIGDSGRWTVDDDQGAPSRPTSFSFFSLSIPLGTPPRCTQGKAGGGADAERWTCIPGCPFRDLSSRCRGLSSDARSPWGPRTGSPGGLGMARQPFNLDWASPRRVTSIISSMPHVVDGHWIPRERRWPPVHPQDVWDMYQAGRRSGAMRLSLWLVRWLAAAAGCSSGCEKEGLLFFSFSCHSCRLANSNV